MTKDPRIDRLVALSGLVRDHRLSQLAAATAARDATVALRDGLVATQSDDPAALQAQAVYGVWVERQREVLAMQIDRQQAEVSARMETARIAFARAVAVAKLRDQLS